MGLLPYVGQTANSGLLVDHSTVVQELVNSLECGVAIANMLRRVLAGATAASLEHPGQAHGLLCNLGDFDSVAFCELGDGVMLAVMKVLQQVMVSMWVEGRGHTSLLTKAQSEGCVLLKQGHPRGCTTALEVGIGCQLGRW